MIKVSVLQAAVSFALVSFSAALMANQWDNYNEPVNMQNVLDPTNLMYDAYGSWYDDGTGMKFHGTNVLSGNPHPTNPAGHGYISPSSPILFQYDADFLANAPTPALSILNDAFNMWDTSVNGTLGIRNPQASLGFSWARAPLGSSYQIDISWQNQAPSSCASVACVMYPNNPSFATPQLSLVFYNQYIDTNGNIVPSNFDFDVSNEPADPGPAGTWVHLYDFLSTSLHELGHLAGLDDLYNLYGTYAGGYSPMGFPTKIMGTPCQFGEDAGGNCIPDPNNVLNAWNPYRRNIDLGSIQGVVDLYTVPEPATLELEFIGMAVLVIGRWQRS